LRKCHNKILLRVTAAVPNTSTSLQTTLTAETHPTEGQFLSDEKTFNNQISVIYRTGTRRPTAKKKRRTEFRTKVNLKKEERIMALPSLTLMCIV
jgi:hypothetical protein